MPTARLRPQGGAVVITVPAQVLEARRWKVGDMLKFDEDGDAVRLAPAKPATRRSKYSLKELLDNTEYPLAPCDREWIDAPAVGKEIL